MRLQFRLPSSLSRSDAPAAAGESDAWTVEREAEESLASALEESDSAGEVLHDSAERAAREARRRLALGATGLMLAASGLLASRRRRRRRRNRRS